MSHTRPLPSTGYDLQLYVGQAGLVPVFQQLLAAMRREGAHEFMLDETSRPVESGPCLRHVAVHAIERVFLVERERHELELFMRVTLADPEGEYAWTKLGLRGDLSKEDLEREELPDALSLEVTALGILRVREELVRLSELHLAPHSMRVLNRLGRARSGEALGGRVDALLQRWSGLEVDLSELLGVSPARSILHPHGGGKPGCLALMADLPERADRSKRSALPERPDPPLLPPQHLVLWIERGLRPELHGSNPMGFSRRTPVFVTQTSELAPWELRERITARRRYLFGHLEQERRQWKEADEKLLRERLPARIEVATSHTAQGSCSHGLVLKVLVRHSVREGVYLSVRLTPDDRPLP